MSFGVEPRAPGTRKDGTFHTRDGGKDRWRPGKTGTLAGWYNGIIAGVVLAFARALGEYGATTMLIGYTPKKTATISTTVYQLWRTNNDAQAVKWVMINIAISAIVLLAVNLLESRERKRKRGAA